MMNAYIMDIFHRLASEASRLSCFNEHMTISTCEVQTAVRLMLPDNLAGNAVKKANETLDRIPSTSQTSEHNLS